MDLESGTFQWWQYQHPQRQDLHINTQYSWWHDDVMNWLLAEARWYAEDLPHVDLICQWIDLGGLPWI